MAAGRRAIEADVLRMNSLIGMIKRVRARLDELGRACVGQRQPVIPPLQRDPGRPRLAGANPTARAAAQFGKARRCLIVSVGGHGLSEAMIAHW